MYIHVPMHVLLDVCPVLVTGGTVVYTGNTTSALLDTTVATLTCSSGMSPFRGTSTATCHLGAWQPYALKCGGKKHLFIIIVDQYCWFYLFVCMFNVIVHLHYLF